MLKKLRSGESYRCGTEPAGGFKYEINALSLWMKHQGGIMSILMKILGGAFVATLLALSSSVKAEWLSTDEILQNPSFEGYSLQGWESTPGVTFFSLNVEGEVTPFTNGVSSSYFIRQEVNLLVNDFNMSLLDSGLVRYDASTWQWGWSGDSDRGRLVVSFINEDGQTLSSVTQGYKDPNTITKTLLSGFIPAATRSILFSLEGQRFSGTNNDAYFGKNSFSLSAEQESLALHGGYFIQGQPVLSDVPTPASIGMIGALLIIFRLRKK